MLQSPAAEEIWEIEELQNGNIRGSQEHRDQGNHVKEHGVRKEVVSIG